MNRALSIPASVLSVAMLSTSAFAADNTANTSNKGSLLIFPKIVVYDGLDSAESDSGFYYGKNTLIRMSNDSSKSVHVKCYWMNETKYKRDFAFKLTGKGSIFIDAKSGEVIPNDMDAVGAAPFPYYHEGPLTGDKYQSYEGELKCWAVNREHTAQIRHNHLSGSATVIDFYNYTAFEYNSWNFRCRNDVNGLCGEPGTLLLNGGLNDAGDEVAGYDYCPKFNIAQFSPVYSYLGYYGYAGSYPSNQQFLYPNEAVYYDLWLGVSSCKQDLRQDWEYHYTKLKFDIWKANEVKVTGAWHCIDSYAAFDVRYIDYNYSNFTFDTLDYETAHVRIKGVRSDRCDDQFGTDDDGNTLTAPTGIVAVVAQTIHFPYFGEGEPNGVSNGEGGYHYATVGSTTKQAGIARGGPGFILWDSEDFDDPDPER